MAMNKICLALAAAGATLAVTFDQYDPQGYYLPSSGTASTTQFLIGTEVAAGTSCGVNGMPNGQYTSGGQGGGPGYLYAAISQLAFGANPGAGAGGPGGACGLCYELTPVSSSGQALTGNSLVFMIADECPTSSNGGINCNQCNPSQTNVMGQPYNFDIAVDAMSTDQYNQFYNGVTDGSNWNEVQFQVVACDSSVNVIPPIDSWGCMSECSNNDGAPVC